MEKFILFILSIVSRNSMIIVARNGIKMRRRFFRFIRIEKNETKRKNKTKMIRMLLRPYLLRNLSSRNELMTNMANEDAKTEVPKAVFKKRKVKK